jgi:hypothetical protein
VAARQDAEMAANQRLRMLMAGLAGFPGIVAADKTDRHRRALLSSFGR